MDESFEEKKKAFKQLGLPTEKLSDKELKQIFDHLEKAQSQQKEKERSMVLEDLLDDVQFGGLFQNILTTDNSDITNLLKQLEKLRDKKKKG